MMYKKLILFTSLFYLVLILNVNAQLNIGVSPHILNLGNINPDSSRIVKFNLISTSDDVVLTYMTPMDGNIDKFKTTNYRDYASNFSEQSVSSWVEFINNPAEVEKTEGGTIKGASEVKFILKISEDVEPGYHMGLIKLDPKGPEKEAMFNIKAVVPLIFIFQVEGKAVRDARIIDLIPGEYSGNNLKLKVFVENTGTVTLTTFNNIVEIFDDDGERIIKLESGGSRIKPNEVASFNLLWPIRDVEEGVYNANVTFDYSTGSATKKTTVEVSKALMPTPQVVKEGYPFTWWVVLVLIIIFIIAYLIYRR